VREPDVPGVRVVVYPRANSRAANGGACFANRRGAVDPAAFGGRAEHRVLARNLVGSYGHVGGGTDAGDEVQIGERGLDHDEVGAFFHVEAHFA